jgi:hypothetical protein
MEGPAFPRAREFLTSEETAGPSTPLRSSRNDNQNEEESSLSALWKNRRSHASYNGL